MIDNETDTTGAETDNAEMRMIIYSDEIHFYVTNETNYQQWMPAWTSWTMPITIKAYNENGHYYLNVTDSGSNEFKTDPIMTLYPAYLHYKIKNTTVSSETEITFEFCYGATTSEIINAWIPVIVTFAMLGTALSFIKKVT